MSQGDIRTSDFAHSAPNPGDRGLGSGGLVPPTIGATVSDMSIPAGPPKDYTALAIIGTILSACTSCIGLITGIIAIVQNNKAKNLYAAGDVAGAYSAANTAKILLIVTWVLVVVGVIFSGGLWISGNYPGLG